MWQSQSVVLGSTAAEIEEMWVTMPWEFVTPRTLKELARDEPGSPHRLR
jgi:hypothetical protein